MDTMTALALNIMQRARAENVVLKALGGVAVSLLCTEVYELYPNLRRAPADIDLAGVSEDSGRIETIAAGFGFKPCAEFNFVNSGERMKFLRDEVRLDIFLDRFRMCHTWSLRDRLSEGSDWTLPLGDILLTKLQVVRPADTDLQDLAALLVVVETSAGAVQKEAISYVAHLASRDWGLQYTCALRISDVCRWATGHKERDLSDVVARRASLLSRVVESWPKALCWRLRAILGSRLRWYAEPET